MVSLASPSPTPFIRCLATPFPCCLSVWPGAKSGSSFLIQKPTRSARCPWLGRILPCLIRFWLWLVEKLCYVGKTCTSSHSSSGSTSLSIRRATDMVEHVTAQHLSRLAYL